MSIQHEAFEATGQGGGTIGVDDDPAVVVKARGYWEQVWLRFRQDRVAIVGGVFIIVLVLSAFFGGPIAARILGHGPDTIFANGVDANTLQPVGPMTKISTAPFPTAVGTKGFEDTTLILGADGQLGRDMFLRILYGAQTSLEVAVFATIFSVAVGVLLGLLAGYFRGSVDTVVSRLTEIAMAFPVLLFIIAVSATIGAQLNKITFGFLAPGVFTLVLIFGIFGWFYPARIIRGQVLSMREKEFVEAARMTGAGDWRIMRSHLLPHLVAPIVVYSSLIVAANVLAEAGLSYLSVGIPPPTASWGSLLSDASAFYLVQPWLMLWPGLAVLLMVVAFNLLGDGLRDAFDPRGTR
jgi:peptide/nickel transport system permease protein